MERKLRATKPKVRKSEKAKVLIFGRPGVGKTHLAIQFPGVFFIDSEGGARREEYQKALLKSGAMILRQEDGAGDFQAVIEEVQTLAMSKHPFRTLVIDSYSKLFNSAIAEEEERLLSRGEKIAFGNEKKPAVKYSRRLVRWLDKIDLNVVLICHERAQWEQGEQVGWTYDGHDKIAYELDLTIRVIKQASKRTGFVAKSRVKTFPDAMSFDWTYDEFSRLYGREVLEGEVRPLKPATEAQVNVLSVLLERIRIDSSVLTKWKEKAGVDSWEQMDSDTIQACIDHLEKGLSK